MCGRFAFINNLDQLKEHFEVEDPTFDLTFNYNVSPSQMIIAVVRNEDKNHLMQFRWGLIPIWAKDEKIGFKLINARSESVHEKASFKNAFKKRRCLIVASGFFEWKKVGKNKIPMYITRKDETPLGLAGLWERWQSPEGEEIQSCTILTTEANSFMEPIHHRMPVIVEKEDQQYWLDNSQYEEEELQKIFSNPDNDLLHSWEVSKFVNSVQNNSAKTIKPVKPSNLF